MYTIVYYKTNRGDIPVTSFLDEQESKAQAKLIKHINLLSKEGPGLRRPYADYLRDGIYELRVKFSPNGYRILYFFAVKEKIVLTHGIVKKSDKVPEVEIEKAIRYKLEFERRQK